jgi:hypothetical protein
LRFEKKERLLRFFDLFEDGGADVVREEVITCSDISKICDFDKEISGDDSLMEECFGRNR